MDITIQNFASYIKITDKEVTLIQKPFKILNDTPKDFIFSDLFGGFKLVYLPNLTGWDYTDNDDLLVQFNEINGGLDTF